jgi:hypothetical protein
MRPFVKVSGMIDEKGGATVNGGRQVTVLADPGASVTNSTTGAIVTASGNGTSLSIFDLTIKNAPNDGTGFGAVIPSAGGSPQLTMTRVTISNNPAGGISVSGGALTMSQSTVSNNAGGGISVSGAQFTIVSNFIASNGGGASQLGGVKIDGITTAGTHRFDFNTVSANLGPTTVNTGVSCGTVTVPLTFSNNIIYANVLAGGGAQQTGGSPMCAYTFSDIGPEMTVGSNINADPMFANASTGNFHLTTNSPCRHVADPNADLTGIASKDIDGDPRTASPGMPADIGADEYP